MRTSRRFRIDIKDLRLHNDSNDDHVQIAQTLLDLIPADKQPLVWIDPTRIICGWGEAIRITTCGHDAGQQASSCWLDIAANAQVNTISETLPNCQLPLALGSFGFAEDTPGALIAPEKAYIWEAGYGAFEIAQKIVATNDDDCDMTQSAQSPTNDGDCQVTQSVQPLTHEEMVSEAPSEKSSESLPEDQWKKAVQAVINHMNNGEATKVVMARRVAVRTRNRVDARVLAHHLNAMYPRCWTYCVDGFIGATPEMLADVHAGKLRCLVLAGTAGRDEGEALFASTKNRREHELAVESVEEVLRPICAQLEVPHEPEILQLPNVTHLATDVSGQAGDASALDIASALHPTAAVCGTPRDVAAKLMKRYENMSRERYAGPIGWIDARGDGQWGIALRGGHIDADDCHRVDIYAGGGIMPDSDPEVEFAETVAKMRPMREAIAAADCS